MAPPATLTPSSTDPLDIAMARRSPGRIISGSQGHSGSHGHPTKDPRSPALPPRCHEEQKHRGSMETSAVISGVQLHPAHCCDCGPCGGSLLSFREWVGSTGVPGTQAGSSVVSRLPSVAPGWPRAAQAGEQLRVWDELKNGCSPSRVPSTTLGVGGLALTFRSEYNRQESAVSETFKNPHFHL